MMSFMDDSKGVKKSRILVTFKNGKDLKYLNSSFLRSVARVTVVRGSGAQEGSKILKMTFY